MLADEICSAAVEDYLDLRLRELLERVAEPRPAPGGGSVLALTAALAAGILTMAARASGREWAEAAGAAGSRARTCAQTSESARADSDARNP